MWHSRLVGMEVRELLRLTTVELLNMSATWQVRQRLMGWVCGQTKPPELAFCVCATAGAQVGGGAAAIFELGIPRHHVGAAAAARCRASSRLA